MVHAPSCALVLALIAHAGALALDDSAELFQVAAHVQPKLFDKVLELQQNWSRHVKRRIVEIEDQKAAARKSDETETETKPEPEGERGFEQEETWPRPKRSEDDPKPNRSDDDLRAPVGFEAARTRGERAAQAAAEAERKEAEEALEPLLREEPQSLALKPTPMPEKEAEALRAAEELMRQRILAKQSRYGAEVRILVHSPLDNFNVSVGSSMRLNILIHSICNRLRVNCSATTLVVKGKPLDAASTVGEFGLRNQDVVEVAGAGIEEELAERARAASRDAVALKVQQEGERKAAFARARQLAEKEQLHRKHQAAKARQNKVRDSSLAGKTVLTFVHITGLGMKKEIEMSVTSAHELGPMLRLVAKRLGVPVVRTGFFVAKDKTKIKPGDSAKSLGLGQFSEILVRTRFPEPVDSTQSA